MAMNKISFKDEIGCFQEPCKASNTVWKRNKLPERKRDGCFTKDRKIYGESNVCSTALR